MVTNSYLTALKNDFLKTGIRLVSYELSNVGHWYVLKMDNLDCIQMQRLSNFIIEKFSQDGKFTHLLPKLVGNKNGCIELVIDFSVVENAYKK